MKIFYHIGSEKEEYRQTTLDDFLLRMSKQNLYDAPKDIEKFDYSGVYDFSQTDIFEDKPIIIVAKNVKQADMYLSSHIRERDNMLNMIDEMYGHYDE